MSEQEKLKDSAAYLLKLAEAFVTNKPVVVRDSDGVSVRVRFLPSIDYEKFFIPSSGIKNGEWTIRFVDTFTESEQSSTVVWKGTNIDRPVLPTKFPDKERKYIGEAVFKPDESGVMFGQSFELIETNVAEWKTLIPILKAYIAGKTIEVLSKHNNDEWNTVTKFGSMLSYQFRIVEGVPAENKTRYDREREAEVIRWKFKLPIINAFIEGRDVGHYNATGDWIPINNLNSLLHLNLCVKSLERVAGLWSRAATKITNIKPAIRCTVLLDGYSDTVPEFAYMDGFKYYSEPVFTQSSNVSLIKQETIVNKDFYIAPSSESVQEILAVKEIVSHTPKCHNCAELANSVKTKGISVMRNYKGNYCRGVCDMFSIFYKHFPEEKNAD